MKRLENTKGNVFAYRYKGVTIRVEDLAFTFWKSSVGYDLFSKDNTKLYFDTLEDAKARIDREKVGA
jgi:hypothetical protein